MPRTITLIPGDGIGPEVTRAVVRIVEATGFTPHWETFKAGAEAVEEHGTTLPPERLDVLLLPNLYGDIVSDLCAGLVGGLGVVPAANLGEGGVGVFEAVHGTAPDIAGRDIANPTALLLSAVLMLQHLHEDARADAIMAALQKVLASGHVTPDLGGTATTTSFADAICHTLSSA